MSCILLCVLGRQRFGAGHVVSLPKGSSWPGTDPYQPTRVGFPFSQKALEEQLVLPCFPCFRQQCLPGPGGLTLCSGPRLMGVEGGHPKYWVKPVAAQFLMGVGQSGCSVWIGPSRSSLKNMSNKDPSSSTASCPSSGKYAPCQPLLPPSSALLGPFPWQSLVSGGDGYSLGRVSPVLPPARAHVLPSLQTISISQHIRAASAVTSGLSSCPWRPKASCTLPQLCCDHFRLPPREGILLTLALEETAAFFLPPSVASGVAGLLRSLSLASPMRAISCRRWTLQELPWMPVELDRYMVLGVKQELGFGSSSVLS